MDDMNFWWYIIAAIIYFFTRSRKKKRQPDNPSRQESNLPKEKPKSFEDLLKEITGDRLEKEEETTFEQKHEVIAEEPQKQEEETRRLEGDRRAFADDKSRKIYEESIKIAEHTDVSFERNEKYQQPGLFKSNQEKKKKKGGTLANEIKRGLKSGEARKAVIYAEILSRKY